MLDSPDVRVKTKVWESHEWWIHCERPGCSWTAKFKDSQTAQDAADEHDREHEVFKPGARVNVKRDSWNVWGPATIENVWHSQHAGYVVMDSTRECGECGHPKKQGRRVRFDEIDPMTL